MVVSLRRHKTLLSAEYARAGPSRREGRLHMMFVFELRLRTAVISDSASAKRLRFLPLNTCFSVFPRVARAGRVVDSPSSIPRRRFPVVDSPSSIRRL